MVLFRNPRFDLLVTVGCVALLGYFAWHASLGPRGRPNIAHLQKELDVLASEVEKARHRKDSIESKVVLMRPESVDPDLLDELARTTLNWAGQQDLIVKLQ